MTNPVFNPDDPRLTAFVLGELDGTDRTEIETLIADSPEAAAVVRELVETVGILSGELAAEPAPKLTATQRAAILDQGSSGQGAAGSAPVAETESDRTSPDHTVSDGDLRSSRPAGNPESTTTGRRFPWAVTGSLVASAAVLLAVASQVPTPGPDNRVAATGMQTESAASSDSDSNLPGDGIFAQADGAQANGTQVNRGHGFTEGKGKNQLQEEQALAIIQESSLMKPEKTRDSRSLRERYDGASQDQAMASLPTPVRARKATESQNAPRSSALSGAGAARRNSGGPVKENPEPAATGETASDKAAPAPANAGGGSLGGAVPEASKRIASIGGAQTPTSLPSLSRTPQPGGFNNTEETASPVFQKSPGQETYAPITENNFVEPRTTDQRLSTFSVDVDTASYTNVRRFLNDGHLPPADAVRIEELINYFDYDYSGPEGNQPFSIDVELNRCPWAVSHRLARIGIKARTIDKTKRPPTSLVFMIDVSGSMRSPRKLPLVKQSIQMLVSELTEDDQVSIVAYASDAGLRLDATSGSQRDDIMQVVNGLTARGSTNGEGGIRTAYDTAIRHFIQGGSNRVIMCTDGDFNVGVNNDSELVALIEEKAASGVFLSIFGFGMGNLKDSKLEKLADRGNGQYGYIDNLRESRKVFSDGLMGTLYTVAKDVKVQVEFNPETVGAYRLIGYENRKLAARDFHDDSKDAGEIGAGHVVTALYEIVPTEAWDKRQTSSSATLRYGKGADNGKTADSKSGKTLPFADELFFINMNYKHPDQETSTTSPGLHIAVKDIPITGRVQAPSQDFMWAASVASFGMQLRRSRYSGTWTLADVLETVEGTQTDDELRLEFVKLVKQARSLIGTAPMLRRPQIPPGGLAPAEELTPAEARRKASLNNKYRRLLKRIEVPGDLQNFGGFFEYGTWDGHSYAGHADLPQGHWVYVFPSWYIWGEQVQTDNEANSQSPSDKAKSTRSDNPPSK